MTVGIGILALLFTVGIIAVQALLTRELSEIKRLLKQDEEREVDYFISLEDRELLEKFIDNYMISSMKESDPESYELLEEFIDDHMRYAEKETRQEG